MKLSKYIDHTLLKADSKKEDILKICAEAKKYDFASVCVNSYWVKTAKEELKGTDVKVCTVVGFPLGAMSSKAKAFEAENAILDGADEIDMVINIGEIKAKNDDAVFSDIKAVRDASVGKTLKVIIETCLLSEEEKIRACEISEKAGADFVKTSTGFSTGGATAEDVALMRKTVSKNVKVKASGGVRSYEDALAMINAGAERLGASSGVKIMENEVSDASY